MCVYYTFAFAIHSLMFTQASDQEFLKHILYEYELALGQSVNFSKSVMVFSLNVVSKCRDFFGEYYQHKGCALFGLLFATFCCFF